MLLSIFSAAQTPKEFTVLQWNIWQEGTMVKGGYEAIVNEIVRLKPDFVTLSEVRNYNKEVLRQNCTIIKTARRDLLLIL